MVKSELLQELCNQFPQLLRKDAEKIFDEIFNSIIYSIKYFINVFLFRW